MPEIVENMGFGWLGVVDALDASRLNYIKKWLFMLGVARDVLYHPPDKTPILDAIQDPHVVAYVANAHGESTYAEMVRGGNQVLASDIETALANRGPIKFSFLIHSFGMDDVGPGTWSSVWRKGLDVGTVVVGTQRGMPDWKWVLWQLFWADPFFSYVEQGMRFKTAFDRANLMTGTFFKHNVRSSGDETISKLALI